MKKRRVFILQFVFLWMIALATGAAQAETLDLTVGQAVELSLKNNLGLKAEALQLSTKQRSKDLAWNAFIPKTGITASISHLNQGPTSPYAEIPNPAIVNASFSTQLNITLALFDGIRHTTLDYESGLIQYETARQKLIRDTKKAFYQLLLLKENITAFEAQLETAQKRYEREKKNFEAGIGSEFAMLTAQVGWENMKPGLDEMQISSSVAELGFKLLLGIEPSTTLVVRGSFDLPKMPLDPTKLVARALENNGDLASLRKAIEIQRNLRRGQFDLDYLPVLGFSFTADPTFQKDPLKDSLFQDPSQNWKQRSGMFSLYLSLPLDGFLPFSGTAVELANRDDGIAQMEISLLRAKQGTEVNVTGLVLQVEKNRRTVERLELNVSLATRAYQMAEKGYESGGYELLQVEDADNRLREAKFQVLSGKFNCLSGLLDLEFETHQSLAEQ